GNDYYDPRNSCLNDVLDRRLGIPITLSVLRMEVGRRVGLHIHGVGLPGHFVVRADVGPDPVLLDPFDGGALLTPERAAEVVARALGRRAPITEQHLAPVTKRQILTRMLMNLKSIYAQRREWTKALAVYDRLLILDGSAAAHFRDRGAVHVRLGHFHKGVSDWERYLTRCPKAEDADAVRHQLLDEYPGRVAAKLTPGDVGPDGPVIKLVVLRDPTLAAFAMPEGRVFLHTGLLSRLENEAQLATILGHEVTHVYERHYLVFS